MSQAHAAGWDRAGRYNKKFVCYCSGCRGMALILSLRLNPSCNGGSSAETRKAYYDRPAAIFGPYQDTLQQMPCEIDLLLTNQIINN
jgi:hypothetical protein